MKALVKSHDVNWFKQVASYANVYVFCIEDEVIGVGSISSFWGSLTESILLTIFVLPELHGNGIGKFIIETLEKDELFLRADRIEIPASITATEFYRIKEMWSELAVTDHAKDRIKECDLYFPEGELRKQLKDTTDARAMIDKFETVENRKKRHDM